MGKIATEQEAYNIGSVGTPISNKCCTKARAEALGCTISGSYLSNQLVKLDDLSKLTYTISFSIKNASTSDDSVHCLVNGTPTKKPDYYDTMYCFEGIYEDITGLGINVNTLAGGDRTYVAIGKTYYWYLYNLNKSRWVLLGTYICTLANNAYYATM